MSDNTTKTNLTNCEYCGGIGYFEIHNAYDTTGITLEMCPECRPNFGQRDKELN